MSPNFEMTLYIAQATGSLIVTDSQHRWEEINGAQHRTNGLVSYPWSGLTDVIKSKELVMTGDVQEAFQHRESGKLVEIRRSIGNIHNAVMTTQAPDETAIEKLKNEFDNACSAKSSKAAESENCFKSNFEYLIPEGGFVNNNVQRLLLSTGVEHHTNNVPMAILVNQVE